MNRPSGDHATHVNAPKYELYVSISLEKKVLRSHATSETAKIPTYFSDKVSMTLKQPSSETAAT